jgi:hypothetical protein
MSLNAKIIKFSNAFKITTAYFNYIDVITELQIIDSCNSLKRYLNICHSVNNNTITESINVLLLKRYYTPKSKLKIVEILS